MLLFHLKPLYTSEVGTTGVISILEAIKNSNKNIKFYQHPRQKCLVEKEDVVLDENSKFNPKSPYAASKLFAHHITQIYRDSYDLFAVNGILFNHESPQEVKPSLLEKFQEQ